MQMLLLWVEMRNGGSLVGGTSSRELAYRLSRGAAPGIAFGLGAGMSFAGYTLPHPLIAEMNVRIITKSAPALDVAIECTRNLTAMCEHMLKVFEEATTM